MILETNNHTSQSVIELDPSEGDVYAWGKTARIKAEPAFLAIYNASKKDLVAVDLASSYPHFRQIMVGQHNQRMQTEARKMTGAFLNAFQEVRKNKIPIVSTFDRDTFVNLLRKIGPRKSLGRELLSAPLYQILVDPPSEDQRNVESVSNFLFERFMNSDEIIDIVVEPEGSRQGDKGNWIYLQPKKVEKKYPDVEEKTLSQVFQEILGDRTPEFLRVVAEYFASQLIKSEGLRRVTFLSFDIMPFNQIVNDAKGGFPQKMQDTLFFKSAQDGERHITGDVLYLPFASNSVDFFTSFEGWPFYAMSFKMDGNIEIARQIADQLVPGGKAVFFGWTMDQNTQYTIEILRQVVKEWGKLGLIVERESQTKNEIRSLMTDREFVLSDRSPLFKQSGIITTLTLSKPLSVEVA